MSARGTHERTGAADELTAPVHDQARELVFLVRTYGDERSAGQDYQAVKDLYYETNELDQFDAVVVGRRDGGGLKILKKPGFPTTYADWAGTGFGLAAGLVMALVPDAAGTGTGFIPGPTSCAGLRVVAGHIGRGVGRRSLEELGERLDASEAALVVAVSAEHLDLVRAALASTDSVLTTPAVIDIGRLTDDAHAAQQEALRLQPRSEAELRST